MIHTTGFDAVRVITTSVPRKDIDPFWTPGNQQRANLSGNFRLFTTDHKENAYLETFGHSGDAISLQTPMSYYSDSTVIPLNFEKVSDQDFRRLFYKTGCAKDENHEFSVYVDYYLESNGPASGYDTYGWLSRSGEAVGVTGYVHSWKSENSGTLKFIDTIPVSAKAAG